MAAASDGKDVRFELEKTDASFLWTGGDELQKHSFPVC